MWLRGLPGSQYAFLVDTLVSNCAPCCEMASLARSCGRHTGHVTGIKSATMRFAGLIGATKAGSPSSANDHPENDHPNARGGDGVYGDRTLVQLRLRRVQRHERLVRPDLLPLGASISVPRTRDV